MAYMYKGMYCKYIKELNRDVAFDVKTLSHDGMCECYIIVKTRRRFEYIGRMHVPKDVIDLYKTNKELGYER